MICREMRRGRTKNRGVAQLGDVCERRRWRNQRAKRSGSDLPNGKLFAKAKTEA